MEAPRRFLAILPKGCYCPTLQAKAAVFELVSENSNASCPGIDASSPSAAGIDAWIEALSQLPLCPAQAPNATEIISGEEVAITTGMRLTSTHPLWLAASAPSLHVANRDPGTVSPIRLVPIGGALSVVCTGPATVQAVDTATLLQRFGRQAIDEAAQHLASAIAAWDAERRRADDSRAREAAAGDEQKLRAAYREIASVAEPDFKPAPITASTDALMAAIAAIVERDGIVVRPPASDHVDDRFDQRLQRIAQASHFRCREVLLDGSWWLEEGPPLLVRTTDHRPMAALWRRRGYHLLDPATNELVPLNPTRGSELLRSGHMLYPTLPDELKPGRLRRFALNGAHADLRAMLTTGALAMLIGLIVPVATGVIVGTAIPQGRHNLIVEMVVLVAAAALGTAAFAAGRSLATIRASTMIEQRLQAAVWDRVLRLPASFFRAYSTGDLARRVLAVDEARRILTGPVLSGLLSGLFASLSLLLMFLYDPGLALYGLGFAAVATSTLLLSAWRQLPFLHAFRDAEGRVTGRIIDTLTGVHKLRLAAAEERAFARWADAFSVQQRANWQSGRIRALRSVISTVMPSLGVLGIFAVAGYRSTPIDLGAFAAFNAAFGQFIGAISGLSLTLGAALEAIPLMRRAAPVLRARLEVDKARADPGRLTGHIAVRGVSFRYREDGPMVLDNVDFTIEPGQFVAIVGPSGSGKSTILRLLLGFETPLTGAILYDDRDLAKLDVRRVRQQIGTVLQNAQLTPGSLYENIAGAAILPDEEVMEAARQAGLADDIENLPMGLETMVSEDAGTISGGQRQRILIARALVRKPQILFFDEATSALDNRTQAIVSDSLEQLKVARMVIAHRLSTIRHADKILVIERGRLVESGQYHDLMAREGSFYRLAQRQLL